MVTQTIANIHLKRLGLAILPAIIVALLSIYALAFRSTPPGELKVLPGSPLAAYDNFYPIGSDESGALTLDKEKFAGAVEYFSENPSPRAIADLIYLGNSNHVMLLLDADTKKKYQKLASGQDYEALNDVEKQKDAFFQSYKDIVNGIGQTFAGTPTEIVLHDTRNPLRSIVAVQNPISGRRVGDTNTNFGVQLIKNYSNSDPQVQGASFVSYQLTLKDGRKVKSSTIPIFHNAYGLIGFICINIDISKMDKRSPDAVDHFVESFRATVENEAIKEMIQNSRKRN
jgi:predicted transcriptional regulator YheO